MAGPTGNQEAAATSPVLDDIHVPLLVCNANGGVSAANAAAQALLGWEQRTPPPGAWGLPPGWVYVDDNGAPLPDASHPVARVLATGTAVHDVTLGIRRPDGRVRWVAAHAGPQTGRGGAPSQVVLSLVDITERRDSQVRYHTLVNAMDAAVLLMRGPVCVDCNPATVRLFGVQRREQLLGGAVMDYAPPRQPDGRPSAEVVQENVALAVSKGTHRFPWLTARADGTPLLLDVHFTAFSQAGENMFLCIALDMSERERAAEALRQSEARFRAIIERAGMGVLVADVEARRFRYANPEICRMLGYAREELLTLSVADIHPQEEQLHVADAFERQRRGEQLDAEVVCQRKDGSRFAAMVRAVAVELEGRACLVGFFRDTTTESLLEQERLRSHKLEAIGVLAGGIAHDFNNLLQAVVGFLSLAREFHHDPAQQREALEDAGQALRLAAGLTSQLLTFSRGGQPVKKVLAMGPLVEKAVRFALSGSPTACQLELAPELSPVEADEAQLTQVIQNLVLNADQAMSPGGTVVVSARNVRAPGPGVPPSLRAGPWVALAVRDHGPGIPAETLPRIFDPYFTTKERGSGLGLATAYSIVRHHGGAMDVATAAGAGSTFTVYLPAAGMRPAVTPPGVRRVSHRSARVLVMDDDALVRRAVTAMLRSRGHTVEGAEDGDVALRLFRTARADGKPFDVVILDLTVPGGRGGVETMQGLLQEDPSVRALVSSGYSDQPAVARYREHGFRGVLQKPYALADLEKALAGVLA